MYLKEIRKSRGMSVEELATTIGLKIRTIRSWEQGTREPCIRDLIILANTLDCSLDDLVGRTKERGDRHGSGRSREDKFSRNA